MLLVIPLGYFVAVFLLVCGVLNCVEYVQNLQQGIDRATMLSGITTTAWPIIAAVVILLLIQVCKQLESLRLAATCPTEESNKNTGKSKKQKRSEEPAEQPANTPQPNLAHLATPAPQPQRYPNSPVPGAARTPQPAAVPQTRVMKQAPKKQADTQGLNYFKVD
jgi:hypothetical protein